MKKINTLLLGITCLLTISGCNDNNSTNTTTNNTNSLISSSEVENKTEKEELELMINNMKKGLAIEGTIDKTFNLLDSYKGNLTGRKRSALYTAEYIFQVGEENGYSSYVTYESDEDDMEVIIDNQVFEGKDGYAYFYDLIYDNTLRKYPMYSMDTGNQINYNYYCLNPFEFLIPEDFTKTGENTYELCKEKAAFISANIFGEIDNAFNEVIDTFEFTVENGNFKSFKLRPALYHDSYTDYEKLVSIYYYAEYEANFTFKNIGTAVIEKIQPKEASEGTETLQKAFDKFKNKNFTAYLHAIYTNGDGELTGENHEYTYYDGESIYMSFIEDQSAHDPNNNNYCVAGANGILSTIGLSYNDSVPKISEVKAEIFTYNEEEGIYSICDEMVDYIGAIAFVPIVSNVTLLLDGYTNQFDIKLDAEGNIECIYIGYTFEYALSVEYGTITLEYFDIDNTRIPHGLKEY